MAQIDFNYPLTKEKVKEAKQYLEIPNGYFLVHINIIGRSFFNELLKEGFSPEKFEKENYGNKILVDGIHYKDLE